MEGTMATMLQEHYNDILKYMNNMKQLGISEDISICQARFIAKLINDAITNLHLEQFVTKQDIKDLHIEQFATKSDLKDLRYDLEKQINETKASIQHLEHKIENKMFKHTTLIIIIVLLTNLPTSVKDLLLNILHLQ